MDYTIFLTEIYKNMGIALLLFISWVCSTRANSIHTVFTTECGQYSVWQSLGTSDASTISEIFICI